MGEFQTTHKLDFLTKHWDSPFNLDGWQEFCIGTVKGQWMATETTYEVLSMFNHDPGNGHLDDVFQWFENSCKRDNRDLVVSEIINDDFAKHLVNKRGFELIEGTENHIKKFRK